MGGTFFLFEGNIPQTTGFLTVREMSKVAYCACMVENIAKELNTLAACSYVVPVRFALLCMSTPNSQSITSPITINNGGGWGKIL